LKHFHALDSLSPFHIVNVRVDSSYLLDQLVASIGYSRIIYSLHNVRSKSVAKYYLDERLTCTTHTLSQKRSHGDGLNLHVVPYGVDIIEGQRACSPARRFPFRYILSIGAIGPHKGVRSAIRIAGGVALPIVVAGVPFDPRGRDVGSYLSTVIDECRLTGGEFVGEVNEAEKVRLIRDAEVVLFCSGMEDLSWEEPFGRVIAEAGLIGTPVAAFDCKSTRDLITAGLTGEFFDSIENAPAAVNNCVRLSRPDIRLQSSMRFSTGRFAEEFLSVCMKVIGSNSGSHGD
jgi:glycosyltransferase involved in cell wall biosynthesis